MDLITATQSPAPISFTTHVGANLCVRPTLIRRGFGRLPGLHSLPCIIRADTQVCPYGGFNLNDSVKMIGHDDLFVKFNVLIFMIQFIPPFIYHLSGIVFFWKMRAPILVKQKQRLKKERILSKAPSFMDLNA